VGRAARRIESRCVTITEWRAALPRGLLRRCITNTHAAPQCAAENHKDEFFVAQADTVSIDARGTRAPGSVKRMIFTTVVPNCRVKEPVLYGTP
jgi:hypothetical protein